jgi:hypothetical protein
MSGNNANIPASPTSDQRRFLVVVASNETVEIVKNHIEAHGWLCREYAHEHMLWLESGDRGETTQGRVIIFNTHMGRVAVRPEILRMRTPIVRIWEPIGTTREQIIRQLYTGLGLGSLQVDAGDASDPGAMVKQPSPATNANIDPESACEESNTRQGVFALLAQDGARDVQRRREEEQLREHLRTTPVETTMFRFQYKRSSNFSIERIPTSPSKLSTTTSQQ